jgi:phosphate-selective porin OprO/OprP
MGVQASRSKPNKADPARFAANVAAAALLVSLCPGEPALAAQQQAEQAIVQPEAEAAARGDPRSRSRQPSPSRTDEPTSGPASLTVFWDQGLRVETLNRGFTLRLGGSVHVDMAGFSKTGFATRFGALESDIRFRRARLSAEGAVTRHVAYKFQYDFVTGNPPKLKDAYVVIEVPSVPLQAYAGRFRTPLGLEGHTSCHDLTFMERGLISAFLPSRNTGIMLYADEERQRFNLHYAVAAIKPESDFDFTNTNLAGFSTRVAYTFTPASDTFIHLGGDYLYRPVDQTTRLLERPESNLAPQLVDTGDIVADSVETVISELAVVRGSWSFQTETAATWVNRSNSGGERLLFWGSYGFVSYMITGETRFYQMERANFGRLCPDEPVSGPGRGGGAMELAFRVSYLDLEDRDLRGGRLLDLTWAFNWHATRNARVMANVIWADPSLAEENGWIAQARLQWAY